MRNDTYWAERMKILEKSLLDTGYEYVQNLEEQFDRAIRDIESQMSAWYQRFANNNNISLSEARRMLTTQELKEFRWTVKEYIKYGQKNAVSQAWMKQLENASARVHISRLDSLKLQLQQQAEVLHGAQSEATEKALAEIYRRGYYHTAFEIQKGLGVGWSLQGLTDSAIQKALSRPWTTDGRTFSDRIWQNKQSLIGSVNTQLTQMIMRGQAPDKAIKAIADRFGVSKRQAGRLVMTESAAFSSMAQKDCYNELDVEEYRIIATLDSMTCDICGDLDNTVHKMSEYVVGSTAPPFHPWCRCCTTPYFADMEGVGERFARDAKIGESFEVPRDMTYKRWKAKQDKLYGEGTVDKTRKMHYNKSADRRQFARYKEWLGKNAPKTFKAFQELKYSDDWELFKAYSRAIKNGELTPLADFELYQTASAEIDKVIIGQTASNGILITGKSYHFIARVVGSVEQRRNGVEIDDVLKAIRAPSEIRTFSHSQLHIFEGVCSASVNPETGVLIQVNPLHGK